MVFFLFFVCVAMALDFRFCIFFFPVWLLIIIEVNLVVLLVNLVFSDAALYVKRTGKQCLINC